MTHCKYCGAQVDSSLEQSFRCPSCGSTNYINSSATVTAIIIKEGRLLTTVRKIEPFKGTRDLPGGFVNPGEPLETALRRELIEETGFDFDKGCIYIRSIGGEYELPTGEKVPLTDCLFKVYPDLAKERDLKARDDVAALEWIPLSSIKAEDFRFPSVQDHIKFILGNNHFS